MKTVSPFVLLVSIMLILSSANSFSIESFIEDEAVQEQTAAEEIDSTGFIKDNIRDYTYDIVYYMNSYNLSEKFKTVILESSHNDVVESGPGEFLDSLLELELYDIRLEYYFNSQAEIDSLLAIYCEDTYSYFVHDQINLAKLNFYLRLAGDKQFMSRISANLKSCLSKLCEQNNCISKEDILNFLTEIKAYIESDEFYDDLKAILFKLAEEPTSMEEKLSAEMKAKFEAKYLEIGKKYGINSEDELNKIITIYIDAPEIYAFYEEIEKDGMAVYRRMAADEELINTLPAEAKELLEMMGEEAKEVRYE